MLAARWPARTEPANNQLLRPRAHDRIWFSTQLLSMGTALPPPAADEAGAQAVTLGDHCSGLAGTIDLTDNLSLECFWVGPASGFGG